MLHPRIGHGSCILGKKLYVMAGFGPRDDED